MTFMKRVVSVIGMPFEKNFKRYEKGMTMIEIIMVIALIGILMTIIVRNVVGTRDSAMVDAAKLGMQQVGQSLDMYRVHNYKYPTSDQGLEALITSSGSKRWRGPYAEKNKLNYL